MKHKVLSIILLILLLLVSGAAACGLLSMEVMLDSIDTDTTAIETEVGDATADASPAPSVLPTAQTEVSITISGAGDCTLGTDEHFSYSTSLNAMYEQQGAAYFFGNVRDIFAADDLTIVNLEGTLTNQTSRMDKEYAFKGKPEYVQILTEGSVEAVNFANNHSRDYGEQSYLDTIAAVEGVEIAVSGYEKLALVEKQGVKIGMTGISVTSGAATEERIQTIQKNISDLKNQGAALVVFSCHWGVEGSHGVTADQVTLAHAAIDAGADLVLGHHPHVLQGIEVYKNRYICYSLGNFCFGGNRNPRDKDTMIFQQTFTFSEGVLSSCQKGKVIPCSLSSVSDRNDYKPTPAQGEEATRIQTNIQSYSDMFQTNLSDVF